MVDRKYNYVIQYFHKLYLYRPVLISGFCRNTDVICALMGHYTVSSDNSLLAFRDNLLVPPSRTGPTGHPETLVRNHNYVMCNIQEECTSYRDLVCRRHFVVVNDSKH